MNSEEIRNLINQAQLDHLMQIGQWATRIAEEFGPDVDFGRNYHPCSWPILVSVEIRAFVDGHEVARHVFNVAMRDAA